LLIVGENAHATVDHAVMWRMRIAAIATLWPLVACSVPALDVDGKACPCADGYVCDTTRNTCVHSLADAGDADTPSCTATFDLCDGFEAPEIDTSLWSPSPGATRDTTRAHRGAASLHVSVPDLTTGRGGGATVAETRTFATATSTLWVRAWFWLSSLPADTNALELASVEQTMGGVGDYLFARSNTTQVYSDFDFQISGTGVAAPTDGWFCVVWTITRSTTKTGELDLSSDVLPMIALHNTVTDAQPSIGRLRLGLNFASTNVKVDQPAIEAWVDDVIVDPHPVTCAD
jgi:hypothetical protein